MKTVLAFAFSAIFFLGCFRPDRPDGRAVFRYNESNGITSLDPAFARNLENMWAVNQLFDGLVQLNHQLEIEPAVARTYTIDSTGTTYTFTLRNDVFFHSSSLFGPSETRKVVAEDVVFSFRRLLDPAVASPGSWIFDAVVADPNLGFTALNDSMVVIRLAKPFPPFLGLLTTQYANIVPREVVEHFGVDFRSNPIGCGPFKFAFWLEDVSLVLHRNEHYYQHDAQGNALPYLDAVQISFVRDITASYLGLLQGRYHFMSGIHPAYKDELLTPNGELRALYHDQLYLSTTPFIKTDYIGLLVDRDHQTAENKALNDVRVRRALVYATDREKMVRYLRNNAVYPANGGFVPPVLPGFEGSVSYGLPHSKEKARALLAEAGYQNGEGLETLVISTTSDYVDLCEFLQYEWGQIGVKLEVEVMAGSVHRERVAKSQAMMFRKSWLADYPDAENFLLLFHTKNFAPAGPNYTHFSNEWFDDQYDRALLQPTPSERQAIYRALDSLVTAEAPVIPLFYDRVTHFVRQEVQGWHTNGVNMIDLTTVQLRED